MVEIIINVTCMKKMISVNKYIGIIEVKTRAMNFRLKFLTSAHLITSFNG